MSDELTDKAERQEDLRCPRCGETPRWRVDIVGGWDWVYLECSWTGCGMRSPLFDARHKAVVWWTDFARSIRDAAVADAVRERDEILGEAKAIQFPGKGNWIDGNGKEWIVYKNYILQLETHNSPLEAYRALTQEQSDGE